MTVLHLHGEPLQDSWLDAYGHLNEAYYLVPFSNANWAVQEHFSIGVAYFRDTGNALYTLESHLRYLDEVRAPAYLDVESMVIAVDAKKLLLAHRLLVDGKEKATLECLLLHYASRESRACPFSTQVREALSAACMASPPEWTGRRVSMGGK